MSLTFPIPDWDDDTFSYRDVIVDGSSSGKVNFKQKSKGVKRKHEAEKALKKIQPGNTETPLQAIKKRKTDKADRKHGGKESKSIGGHKDVQKKKKKKVQKAVKDSNHPLEISPNQESSKSNTTEQHTEAENKSLPHKRKKKRKNNNKYKALNIKQKAEKIAQKATESKDSLGNKAKLEQEDLGSVKSNVVLNQAITTKEAVQSSPNKKAKKKKKKKANVLESKYNNESQESSTDNKKKDTAKPHQNGSHDTSIACSHENKVNHNQTPITSTDVKKKKKKKSANKSLDSPTLPHSKEASLCLDASEGTQNEGTGEKLKIKKKNKIKGKKTVEGNIKKEKEMESSLCTEKSEKVDDDDKQDGTVKKKKKKKKKDKLKENGLLLKIRDTVTPKKAKMEKQKTGGKLLKTEDSEAEDMTFDDNEECSEEFNKDFNALFSSLNFSQFNSTKKSKRKGNNEGGNSKVKNKDMSKMENGKDSVDEEWEGEDNGNTKEMMSMKRKRDSAKADSKEVNGKKKKKKTVANNSDAARNLQNKEINGKQKKINTMRNNSNASQEPKTPVKKGAKFNREKLSKLLEVAANMERERPEKPSPSSPPDPVYTLKKKMEDRLTAARFRLVNQELYTKSSTEAKQLFKKDPEAFHVYHQGYQAQVRQWPVSPLDLIVTWLSKKPEEWVVADMGCGEATLAQRVPQSHVHSLDLVAANDQVTACDMAHTPLAAASVDVVVFCLSLMGTNLKDFMIEANRILREGGIMKIAEVESRCGDVQDFEKQLGKFGFHCTDRDTSYQYFFLLEFKKNRKLKKIAALPDLHLKPCLYKKR